jgi:hypothetical protein
MVGRISTIVLVLSISVLLYAVAATSVMHRSWVVFVAASPHAHRDQPASYFPTFQPNGDIWFFGRRVPVAVVVAPAGGLAVGILAAKAIFAVRRRRRRQRGCCIWCGCRLPGQRGRCPGCGLGYRVSGGANPVRLFPTIIRRDTGKLGRCTIRFRPILSA